MVSYKPFATSGPPLLLVVGLLTMLFSPFVNSFTPGIFPLFVFFDVLFYVYALLLTGILYRLEKHPAQNIGSYDRFSDSRPFRLLRWMFGVVLTDRGHLYASPDAVANGAEVEEAMNM